jgi:hypothetical protein
LNDDVNLMHAKTGCGDVVEVVVVLKATFNGCDVRKE